MGKLVQFPRQAAEEISIEEATHWIPREINPLCEGRVTLNKAYKIHYNEMTDEFYMIDDCGSNSVWFVVVDGECVRL